MIPLCTDRPGALVLSSLGASHSQERTFIRAARPGTKHCTVYSVQFAPAEVYISLRGAASIRRPFMSTYYVTVASLVYYRPLIKWTLFESPLFLCSIWLLSFLTVIVLFITYLGGIV
jgi:hypothetical protein